MRVFGNHRRWVLSLVILGAGLTGSALLITTGPQATPVAREERAWPVSTQVVQRRQLAPRFSTWATVEASQVAHLRAAVDAPVRSVHVRAGDRVAAGEVLVRLDDTDFVLAADQAAADVSVAQAQLATLAVTGRRLAEETAHQQRLSDIAAAKLARYERLFADGTVSSSIVDEVRREASQRAIDLARHRAELDDLPNHEQRLRAGLMRVSAHAAAARVNLERTVIRAPFAGPVLAVQAAPGDRSSAPLVTVADAASMELRAAVPERFRQQLHNALAAGSAVGAQPASEPGQRSTTTPAPHTTFALRRLAADVKSGQSGTNAWFAVPPAQTERLEIGRVFGLDVVLPPQPELVAVPAHAMYDSNRLYVIEAGRLKALEVERLGETRDTQGRLAILVRSEHLLDGSTIMTTQLPGAISGMRVERLDNAAATLATRI